MSDEMEGQAVNVNSKSSLEFAHAMLDEKFLKHKNITLQIKASVTQKQQNAMHLYCARVAQTLNAAGITVRMLIESMRSGVELSHTKDTIKTLMYKPVLKAMTGKGSTTQQNTVEPQEVEQVISKHLIEKWGLTPPQWPSKDND